jgi:type VI secretion system protein ImpE
VVDAPQDLRDLVWLPAHLYFENGGESVALIPTRYPGSERSADENVALAKKTTWSEPLSGFFVGLGQRILATDTGETPLTEVREIVLDGSPSDALLPAQA